MKDYQTKLLRWKIKCIMSSSVSLNSVWRSWLVKLTSKNSSSLLVSISINGLHLDHKSYWFPSINIHLNNQHLVISKALLHPDIIKCLFLCTYMLSSEVGGKLDYSPVSWQEYFDQMEDVNVGPADSTNIFRIYKAGSDGPLLVLLHGGGHSALSWAVFTVSINATTSTNKGV